MGARVRASILARVSIWANRKRGGLPHLTICAEMWILDRRLWCALLDAIILVIWWERNHCRNQYIRYGINQRTLHGFPGRSASSLDPTSEP